MTAAAMSKIKTPKSNNKNWNNIMWEYAVMGDGDNNRK